METNMERHNKIEHFIVQLERTKKFGKNWRVAGRIISWMAKSLFNFNTNLFFRTSHRCFSQFPKLTSLPVTLASRRDLLAAAPAAVAPIMPGAPAQAAAKAEIAHSRSLKAAKLFFRIFHVHSKCEKTF